MMNVRRSSFGLLRFKTSVSGTGYGAKRCPRQLSHGSEDFDMNRTRNLLISTVSAVAIAALPLGINFSATGWLGLSVASAKNDKSSEKSDNGSGAGKGGAGKQGKSSERQRRSGQGRCRQAGQIQRR